MTDPVEVLARYGYAHWASSLSEGERGILRHIARKHIAALERAGFKVIARPVLPDVSEPNDALLNYYNAISGFWDAAPTYGDKP